MKTLNEEVSRIKQMMNINEDDSQMALIQQETQEFNEKVDEELTPEQYESVMGCTDPDEEESLDLDEKDKQAVATLKEKMKVASFQELLQLKKQLKQLRKQNEQVAAPAVMSFLGVTMSPGAAIVAGMGLLLLTLFLLGRLLFPRTKVITYRCNKPDRGY
jgi:hypothetical protein